jgi:hypothetical protein
MVLGISLHEFNPESALLLKSNQYSNRYESTITLRIIFLQISGISPHRCSVIIDLWLKNPKAVRPDNGAIKEKSRPQKYTAIFTLLPYPALFSAPRWREMPVEEGSIQIIDSKSGS